MEANDYKGRVKPSWCPGCGNHAVLMALKKAMAELNYQTHETAIVSGIGCSSRFPFFMSTYGFHTIHGRALPVAIGLKQAKPEINVIGLNVEESVHILDKYIDDCTIAKVSPIRIVHGKGTGKLREGIHRYLKTNSHVASFRLGTFGEGEMGVTVVELKI